jgi:hypothetical protein
VVIFLSAPVGLGRVSGLKTLDVLSSNSVPANPIFRPMFRIERWEFHPSVDLSQYPHSSVLIWPLHVQPEEEVPTIVCNYLIEKEKLAPVTLFLILESPAHHNRTV